LLVVAAAVILALVALLVAVALVVTKRPQVFRFLRL